jgi:hypothetical protein
MYNDEGRVNLLRTKQIHLCLKKMQFFFANPFFAKKEEKQTFFANFKL